MDTIYEDEATRLYDGDELRNGQNNGEMKKKSDKSSMLTGAAVSGGAGVLIGGLGAMVMGHVGADAADATSDGAKANLSHPEWVDDKVNVAGGVDDGMSFAEAFAAARAEVGAGGVFEWHGKLYGTYYAEEWANMSAAEKAEFGNHFSWNHIDHTTSDVAAGMSFSDAFAEARAEQGPGGVFEWHGRLYNTYYAEEWNKMTPAEKAEFSKHVSRHHSTTGDVADYSADPDDIESDDNIEVVGTRHVDGMAMSGYVNEASSGDDGEVEILGVVDDTEAVATVAGMNIPGEDVILIDVDNDMKFDYMGADTDVDGQLDNSEMADISDRNLTVDALGCYSQGCDNVNIGGEIDDSGDDFLMEV